MTTGPTDFVMLPPEIEAQNVAHVIDNDLPNFTAHIDSFTSYPGLPSLEGAPRVGMCITRTGYIVHWNSLQENSAWDFCTMTLDPENFVKLYTSKVFKNLNLKRNNNNDYSTT